MKLTPYRKNRRRQSAYVPPCPNCGEHARHELYRTYDDVIAGRRWFACEPKIESTSNDYLG